MFDVWRERVVRAGLVLMYSAAGVLVLMDFMFHMRVGRLGLYLIILAGILTVKREIGSRLAPAWDAGELAGRRHEKLAAASGEPNLKVVRDMARPR